MPSIFTHAAVPLALRLGLGGKAVSSRLLACGMIGSMLPDLDVIGLRLGVSYASEYGHRGFTHSLLFAGVA
ncbi:MAG: metal-dependent hydrolase, partial [Burkholderiales bacterium]